MILSILATIYVVVCQSQVLYEISGNSTQDKSYLLATNRLTDITFLDTIPNVFKVFGNCNRVVTEFAMQDYEALAALRQAAILPDSVILRNFYSETDYNNINQALQLTLGMGFDQVGRMRPAFLTEMYRNELMRKWLDYNEQRSMENFFEKIAAEKNIPVEGLDNVGETMYILFEREPVHWQCEELKKVIDYPEREVRLEKDIKNMYREGRINDIAYLLVSPDNHTSLSYSDYQVYAKRNLEWVKRLAPYLKEGKTFINLNAIYIGGDKGLIACLRNAGYRVRAVNRGKLVIEEQPKEQ
ncbi:MAG: TraB/GumN family protein [Paludibacteraceae bacterium]|nr:TraB/GumN family protein [Paludibacteraceae bacterium]